MAVPSTSKEIVNDTTENGLPGRVLEDLAGKAAEQARAYGDKAQKCVTAFRPYVKKSMKEQPMATLAVASVIGWTCPGLVEG
jgi:hypothetical protein